MPVVPALPAPNEPRPLGPFTVGPLAFGCWRFGNQSVTEARALIDAALAAGMNLIDTADIYGDAFGEAEALLGRVLAEDPSLREAMVLATKGGIRPGTPYDSSATYLRQACEDSLRRLSADTIDLYQIHRPDLFAHPADAAETLAALHAAGKIRSVGVSNYTVAQTEALARFLPSEVPFVATQPQFSAVVLDPILDGTLDLCCATDIRPLAWSPLAGGALARNDASGVRPELIAVLDELATREGVDRASVAIAWVLHHPSRPVAILGTQRPERVGSSTAALNVRLERVDLYRIIEASTGERLP